MYRGSSLSFFSIHYTILERRISFVIPTTPLYTFSLNRGSTVAGINAKLVFRELIYTVISLNLIFHKISESATKVLSLKEGSC